MLTLKEMRKRAKELGFKFDVCFLGWDNGERIYNLTTEDNVYICIRYKKVLNQFELYEKFYTT